MVTINHILKTWIRSTTSFVSYLLLFIHQHCPSFRDGHFGFIWFKNLTLVKYYDIWFQSSVQPNKTSGRFCEKRRTSSNSLFIAARNLGKHRLFQAVKNLYCTAIISTPPRYRG